MSRAHIIIVSLLRWNCQHQFFFCLDFGSLYCTIAAVSMKVAVIGGGPSGLVTLKYLLKANEFFPIKRVEARLFENETSVGGTFKPSCV
jgi:hypothetical protein